MCRQEPGGPIGTPMLVTVSACLKQKSHCTSLTIVELAMCLEFAAILFASVSSGLGLQVCATTPSMSKTVFRATGPRLVAHIGTTATATGERRSYLSAGTLNGKSASLTMAV